jgi:hypothetical protein
VGNARRPGTADAAGAAGAGGGGGVQPGRGAAGGGVLDRRGHHLGNGRALRPPTPAAPTGRVPARTRIAGRPRRVPATGGPAAASRRLPGRQAAGGRGRRGRCEGMNQRGRRHSCPIFWGVRARRWRSGSDHGVASEPERDGDGPSPVKARGGRKTTGWDRRPRRSWPPRTARTAVPPGAVALPNKTLATLFGEPMRTGGVLEAGHALNDLVRGVPKEVWAISDLLLPPGFGAASAAS